MNEETEAQRGDTILPSLHNQNDLTKSVCGTGHFGAQRRGCEQESPARHPLIRAHHGPVPPPVSVPDTQHNSS